MKRKRRWRRFSLGVFIFLFLWIILAQSCMKFRISDKKAKEKFSGAGVPLTTAIVNVEGYHMHYVKTGNDSLPTLFFIHGSPGSWTAFERYIRDKELLEKYRMISIDRPGFGYSEFGKARDLSEQSQLIKPVLDQLKNNKPMYVIGHSLGGPMAIKLAADNPGTFAGIVLLAPSVDPSEEKPEKWRPWLMYTPLKYFIPGALAPSNRELWYLKKDLVKLKTDFPKIECPVWIIQGDKDNLVPPGNAGYAAKMLIHSPLIETTIIEGAGHFIPWNHYTDIRAVLLKLTDDKKAP